MANGAVKLADLADRTTHIEVACTRCERKGKYLLARLVHRLGPDFLMTDLGAELASCPSLQETAAHKRCDVYFPNLVQAMSGYDDGQRASEPETDCFEDDD